MCTVSFLPKARGFYLAMNRDEKRDRFAALAPTIINVENRRAIFPREPTGGTWISVNDAGICLALINWHRIKRRPKNEVVSRGEIIRELAGKSNAHDIQDGLTRLPLRNLRPFRLITIVPTKRGVLEWRWNLERLAIRNHKWQRQHWFSSGFDERRAERERAKICESPTVNAGGYNLKWLRELHRSHAPKRGPFSICMHRPDASTVSYIEVSVQNQSVVMRYKNGRPCSRGSLVVTTL
jgi:hypothetical protein